MLANLGSRIRQIDDAYAQKVQDLIIPDSPSGSPLSVIRSMGGAIVGSPLTHGLPQLDANPRMIERVAQYAIPATSATVRYALPVAGVTLAGQQLLELTNRLYNKDEKE